MTTTATTTRVDTTTATTTMTTVTTPHTCGGTVCLARRDMMAGRSGATDARCNEACKYVAAGKWPCNEQGPCGCVELPGSSPTPASTTTATTAAPTTAAASTTAASSGECAARWGQCGGKTWAG